MINLFSIIVFLHFASNFCLELQHAMPEIAKHFSHPFSESESDYDLTPVVHTFHKRDTYSTMRIRAFKRNITLYLEQKDGILIGSTTPVYLASHGKTDRNQSSKITYTRYPHELDFRLYCDRFNDSVLIFVQKGANGIINVTGFINDYIIQPIKGLLKKKFRMKRDDISTDFLDANENETYSALHVVRRMKQSGILGFFRSAKDKKINQQTYNKVYPKILVWTDYKTFSNHGNDVDDFIRYMTVFWTGVDLFYRALENPLIRLHIAAIIIPQQSGIAKYVEQNTLEEGKAWDVDVIRSFSNFLIGDPIYEKNPYDVAVGITNYNLIMEKSNNSYSETVTGISNFGKACQRVNATAIVQDNSRFSGVRVAAHELAHLFGVSHDGSKSIDITLTGGEDCPYDDGYLMSYEFKNEKSSRWSQCSIKSLQSFFASERSKCMHKKPVSVQSYPKMFPGTISNLTEQCKALIPGARMCSAEVNKNVCHELFCYNEKIGKCVSHGAALEGSHCINGICLMGDCVPFSEINLK